MRSPPCVPGSTPVRPMPEADVDLRIEGLSPARLVHRGADTELYRAVQQRFHRRVAVKVYTGGGVRKRALAQFQEECARMGSLSQHPHIVDYISAGQARRGPYVVTEWLDDGTFQEVLDRDGPIPWQRALDIGAKLAGALETAHRGDILHRKIKPEDVFVTPFGDPVLGDFQLDPSAEGRSGDPFDRLLHAAPELVQGGEASPGADVYALASTIHTLVGGRAPFMESADESLAVIKQRALSAEPRALGGHDVPLVVQEVLRWGLRPDPGNRPATAQEFGRALQAAQLAAGQHLTPVLVRPATPADDELPAEPTLPARIRAAAGLVEPAGDAGVARANRSRLAPDILLTEVQELTEAALEAWRGTAVERRVESIRDRLAAPLRVAIAGRVKAGKSTLLNGLVGDHLAPTDASECTKVVTWYRRGHYYKATLYPHDGEPTEQAPTRDEGAIDIDLGDLDAGDLERIVVDWPSPSLQEMTLIDTPGIASVRTDVSARTHAFLEGDGERETEADAVIYLMRYFHPSDLRFLEAFHDDEIAHASAVNALGVLSRADELGGGMPDAMDDARRVAERYRSDPQIRRLCQTVVPVAGLLAQAGGSLQQSEYDQLARLAALDDDSLQAALASADRFTAEGELGGVPAAARRRLVDRFGMFGVSLAVRLIGSGEADSASALARQFAAESGLQELRDLLLSQFDARRGVLKARSALQALDHLRRTDPPPDGDAATELARRIEQIQTNAHLFAEMRLFAAHRAGAAGFPADRHDEVERLLGANGFTAAERLGLSPEAGPHEIREAAREAHRWWRDFADVVRNPLVSLGVRRDAEVLVQTLEGISASI